MKWRSEYLPFIGFGVIFLAIALSSNNQAGRQNAYASREACLRDYDENNCRSGGSAGGYYGPRYYGDRASSDDPGPGRTASDGRSQAAMSISEGGPTRGGFGETARGGRGYGG